MKTFLEAHHTACFKYLPGKFLALYMTKLKEQVIIGVYIHKLMKYVLFKGRIDAMKKTTQLSFKFLSNNKDRDNTTMA